MLAGVGVAVAVAVAVGVPAAVAVGVGVGGSGVGVAVEMGVGEGVADGAAVGVGVAVELSTTRYLESLGIPLVKTVTKAGPGGKLFSGVEVKEVSDQPAVGSTGRKSTWLLSLARS